MAYFPMFVELNNKQVLIVGGGRVALRKVTKLLPYGASITVCAPTVCDEILKLSAVKILTQSFCDELLNGADMVIAATDDRELNRRVSALCREQKIPVNTVDDPELCSFIFPCLVKSGSLSVGISTGGASPSAAQHIKEKVYACIPDGIDDILDYLSGIRPAVKELFPSEAQRSGVFKELTGLCLDLGRPLTQAETEEYFENVR